MFTEEEIKLAPKVYEAIKKIAKANSKKWEWKPEWAEYIVYRGEVGLITGWLKLTDGKYYLRFLDKTRQNWDSHSDEVIPLFRWETIEKILEEMEYYMSLPTRDECSDLWVVGFSHFNFKRRNKEFRYYKDVYVGRGRTRQEAVMRAIIKLGEEK